MGVKLTGADDVRGAVETLGVSLADAVGDATVKAGNLIMADARRNAPVGKRGRLNRSSNPRELRDSIRVRSIGLEDITVVEVYSDCDHAIYVEYGTGQRGDQSVPHRADWAGMPAQPYFRPAFEGNIKQIQANFNAAVLRAARKIAKR